MFRIVLSFFLAVFFSLAGACFCYAQTVPMTAEYDLGGFIPGLEERDTCDPDMQELIDAQAWEAAQREITQNANLYPRPDSVLSLTCFDRFLNHQARYADRHFPDDPDESTSEGLFKDVVIDILVDIEKLANDVDPVAMANLIKFSGGYSINLGFVSLTVDKYGLDQANMLEFLVLDQLVDVGSNILDLEETVTKNLCGSRDRYIEDNFPGRMIGGRATTQSATPSYVEIMRGFDNREVGTNTYRCEKMNQVWQRAKCYDFATEDNSFYPFTTPAFTGAFDHDGFYMYYRDEVPSNARNDYVSLANLGGDYRTLPSACEAPNEDYIDDLPNLGDLACMMYYHGMPPAMPGKIAQLYPPGGGVDLSYLISVGLAALSGVPDGSPEWQPQYDDANPLAGTPSAGDVYQSYIEMVNGSINCLDSETLAYVSGGPCTGENLVDCSAPVRTGLRVIRDGSEYWDSVCPNPGCYFVAPASSGATGSCSR